jgi:cytosine/adenosine deaminase-related metal-dependent hydrolase
VQVDNNELAIMAEAGVTVAHCPTTALKVSWRHAGRQDARDGHLGCECGNRN